MDFHKLEYFKAVADLQHVTKAAEMLHVAQPSVSRSLSNLEEELGVELFDRSGKNIVLNRYGEIVLRHANRILNEIDAIPREINELKEQADSTVSVSMRAASKLLPQMVMTFHREHPEIHLSITHSGSTSASAEDADIWIYSSADPVKDTFHTVLLKEELLLALPETSPLALKEKIDLRDTKDMGFICLYKGKALRQLTDMYCLRAGFTPNIIYESDSPDTVRGLIQAGLGIAMIPSISWAGTDSDNIVLRRISHPECYRYLNMGWRDSSYHTPAVKTLRNFIISYFKRLEVETIEDCL